MELVLMSVEAALLLLALIDMLRASLPDISRSSDPSEADKSMDLLDILSGDIEGL